jgi:hypothetical protein
MKSILIYECDTHEKNVNEYYKLLKNSFRCKILTTKKIAKNLHNIKKNDLIIYKGPKIFSYIFLIIKAINFDYIYITSALEYPYNPKGLLAKIYFLLIFLFFIIFLFFFRNKTIIKIVSIYSFFYIKNFKINNNFFSKLRYLILIIGKKFLMETEELTNNLKKYFSKSNIIKNKLFTYMYIAHVFKHKQFNHNNQINLGVLGVINSGRKNYSYLLNALKKIKIKKENINIYFLGENIKGISEKIIKKFNKYKIFYPKSYLKDDAFIQWGSKCNILLSLNRNNLFYGSLKGSGSYGDAIFLQKPLVVPNFFDKKKEFKDFMLYYKNSSEFKKIIYKILNKKILLKPNFNNYYYKKHLQRISNDLKLN